MQDSTRFKDLMADITHPAVSLMGLRVWPAGGSVELIPAANTVKLFLVITGILCIENQKNIERVLPREALRLASEHTSTLKNLSKTDEMTAIEIDIKVAQTQPSLPFTRFYHPDESKDNKLCLIASDQGGDGVLVIPNPAELYLSCLGRWESILFDHQDGALLVVLRGSATVAGELHEAVSNTILCAKSPTSVVGKHACEILAIRMSPQ